MVELITHVDEHDNVLGARPKTDFFNNPSLYCRTSHLYLFNLEGKLLIQQRTKTRKNYPGMYDASVSGTVREKETYEEALVREAGEELGIKNISYNLFLKGVYSDDVHTSHKSLYTAIYNGPITFQKEEVEKIYWMSRSEITKEMKKYSERFCPPFLEELEDIINKKQLTDIFK
ncbi:NUDIX domain-containing protein [Candidatus Parcubacteria bacterium]|jgi:isopentenyldiphosphate isomerase|nr:NUDIX domain-containing protein [Candidatus Parcubacteria bacterium]MBT3948570.1 NUDIX domain-containing protein [Candidatus Parcubacteria bacterium]